MMNFISRRKLLVTTAICAISVCANNTVKAEEISILDILNNSTTKSPNISWEKVTSAGKNTIQIGDEYYKYTWTNEDSTWGKYTEHQYNTLSGNVKADFIGISARDTGAIYNIDTISSITGDFIGNSAISTNSYVEGGAIFNGYNGTISSITGDFIGNSATSTNDWAYGGAIYNGWDSIIESISGDFIGNSATSTNRDVKGGAIYNNGTISSISGDFIGNSATATNNNAYGGAIYNHATISSITGDFTGNSAIGNSKAYGGAIYNAGTISSITGDFIGNSATSTNSDAYGGAIYNGGTIETITGDFIGNSATSTNSSVYGGAIYNWGTISSIAGDFIGNSATGSSYTYGGAIYNRGTISSISGDFTGNSATSTDDWAYGGAIYNNGTINFVADASDSEDNLQDDVLFQGNYIQRGNNDKQYQAIYNDGTINFAANNGGSYTFYDYIYGSNGTINFTADGGIGTLNLYDKADIGSQQAININDAYVINLAGDGLTSSVGLNNLNINADISMNIDVSFDWENNWNTYDTADKITGKMTKADGVSFELGRVNLLSDMGEEMEAYRGEYNSNYSGILTDNIGEMNITSDTGTEYDGYNDGRYVSIYKQNLSGGLAEFLADVNRSSTTYDFTGDENLKIWFGPNGKRAWIEGDTTDKTITINGNGHKISPNIKGISGFLDNYNGYDENELVINDLTIEGFGGVDALDVLDGYNITLNNVIFQNNHGYIWNDIYGNIYNSKFINNSYIIDGEGENDGYVYGLDIYNGDELDTINADFIGTYVSMQNTTYVDVYGGAVDNDYKIENLHGNFVSNVVELKDTTGEAYVYGVALYNGGGINSLSGDFVDNHIKVENAEDLYVYGGAVYNDYKIENLHGNFEGNKVELKDATGEAYVYGGAVYNGGGINSLSGDFVDNHIKVENAEDLYVYGGAVYNYGKSILQEMVQDWNGYESFEEYAQDMWGLSGEDLLAEYGISSEEEITPEIVMYMDYGYLTLEDFVENEGYDSVEEMLDDYGYASMQEMAISWGYYDKFSTITLVADASDSEDTLQDDILIKGNYIEIDGDKRYEAIYNKGIINFESNNGGSYTFYDYINGENPGTLNFVSDDNKGATINLYNNIQNQKDINFQNKYVLNMISPDDIHQDVFTSKYSYIQSKNININAALQVALDVDLETKEMDRFEADNFTISATGSIDVTKFNIVTDVTGDIGTTTEVEFIVSDNATGLDKITNVTEAIGEIYTYTVTFNPDTGAFEFVSTGLAPEPVTPAPEEVAPNQAISVVNTTTVATVETVVAQIFDRDVTISTDINYGSDTTDYMETSDGVNISNDKSLWVKTFGSDDDVEVDNFNSKIDAESYGVVGGVDSKVFTYDNGVKAAYGIYGAYVGGKQKYDDNKVEQKSGYLGVSAAFRKNNMFSNFTLNGGYITSEANTSWGKDEFDTKVVSVANKTGVDIKAGNNWTVTPAMYVAYTGMDTEDYTNKAGVKMENEFSNVITIAPELKVRKGFDNGVGAYAKASYKHYIYDAEVKADDVLLEEMSAKPYVEYGFGVEKNWADKSGYVELTRRDGGREGWNVNLGLKLDF